MMKESTSKHGQHEPSINTEWLRVLEFGADVTTVKMKSQSVRPVQATRFVVLP